MKKMDRLSEEYGVPPARLMENAGRLLAELAEDRFPDSETISILAGKGNNSGDGLTAARYLQKNHKITVILASSQLKPLPQKQLQRLRKVSPETKIFQAEETENKKLKQLLKQSGLVIDSLFGFGLKGDPKGIYSQLIRLANSSSVSILSCDLPSGLNADSGKPLNPCIRAEATLTLALPKSGLLKQSAKDFVGELYLADIGIPEPVYKKFGLKKKDIFQWKEIVEVK